ncbi:hypothetical protein [Neptuniibacter marinus]|uniref:hypothetical protein n=1 Tax=Neptuniibacter marinus TaxID=1806670 RepID=UPI0008365644|nr:hypothetical protein [Neptuniibacter marinus]
MSNESKRILPLPALLATVVLALSPSLVSAGDAANGEVLYHEVEIEKTIHGEAHTDANCETCHDSSLYMSEQRKVTTFAKLEAFVEGCNTNLDVGWFPEDVADVASYLNKEYYKFEE